MLIYIAGPYHGEKKDKDTNKAERVTTQLLKIGHSVICPYLNNRNLDVDPEVLLKSNFQQITRCDMLYVLNGWKESEDVKQELELAERLKIPYVHEFDLVRANLPLHITEQRAPVQCRRFAEILGQIYRTHLKKNADYSPANILGTGYFGCVVRLWDKMARLMNLSGFRLKVELLNLEPAMHPENEPIDDTFKDMAVYAIITQLVKEDSWGQ